MEPDDPLDLLDGTPVLDITPYVPTFDSVAAERAGWLEQAAEHVAEVKSRPAVAEAWPRGSGPGLSEESREPPGARERWNRRYAERGVRVFPEAPADWLVENRAVLSSTNGRRALDLACGDGRNAAYLVQLGFEVDAVDISDVVIAALHAAAIDRHLAVNPYRIDLERDPLPGSDYDVIVQLNYLQRSLAEPIARALAPGGILVIETVTRAHVEELGNQFDPRFLLERNELLASFGDLEVLHYAEGVAERSGRPRAVAGLVARRSNAAVW